MNSQNSNEAASQIIIEPDSQKIEEAGEEDSMLTKIKNARIFDGNKLLETASVYIDGDKILLEKPADREAGNVIDGTGCTLLPGLIDGHVHMEEKKGIETPIKWGVTTMVDMCPPSKAVADSLRNVSGLTDIITSYAPVSYPTRKRSRLLETGSDGTVTLELNPSDYYLRELKSPSGYKLDSTKILFTVSKAGVTVKVEVTNELETVIIPDDNPPMGGITVPKTGEAPTYGNYILALLCLSSAGLCGATLYRGRKTKMIG